MMDEKTAELRDLFVETTGEEGVTQRQTAARGSLSAADDAAVDEEIDGLVAEMTDRYEFTPGLAPADLRRVVQAFFDPETGGAGSESWSADADAAVASSLDADVDSETVLCARLDLHLVADADRDPPFPYAALRDLVLEARSDADSGSDGTPDDDFDAGLASALDADVGLETVRRYRRVVEADLASRRVNHRYRDAFADLLTDDDLSTRLATDVRRDGLEEATEDIETDVSL